MTAYLAAEYALHSTKPSPQNPLIGVDKGLNSHSARAIDLN